MLSINIFFYNIGHCTDKCIQFLEKFTSSHHISVSDSIEDVNSANLNRLMIDNVSSEAVNSGGKLKYMKILVCFIVYIHI